MIRGEKNHRVAKQEQETLKDKLDGASARLDEIEEILSAIQCLKKIRTRRGYLRFKYIGKLKTDIQRTNDERGKIEEEKAMKASLWRERILYVSVWNLIKDKHNYEIALFF